MLSLLPPNFWFSPVSNRITDAESGAQYNSSEEAWDGFMSKEISDLPPGFVFSQFEKTKPVYCCITTGERFSSLGDAWKCYREKKLFFRKHLVKSRATAKSEALAGVNFDSAVRRTFELISFTDFQFPPDSSSFGDVFEELPTSKLYISKKIKDSVRWVRLPEVISSSHPGCCPVLFGAINPNTLSQGSAGDCWLIAVAACLAEYPQVVQDIFDTQSENLAGRYTINFFDLTDCAWEKVTIDDLIPCVFVQGKPIPVFARPSSNEMWAVLLEKAMAKFVGSYAAISGGHEAFAFFTFTGFPQVYQFRRQTDSIGNRRVWERGWSQWNGKNPPTCGFRPSLDGEVLSTRRLFKKLSSYNQRNYLTSASITTPEDGKTQQAIYRNDGIVTGHAYSVLATGTAILSSGDSVELILLRNPHGAKRSRETEWIGAFSDEDEIWSKNPTIRQQLNYIPSNDGMFWMPFLEFAAIFNRIVVLPKQMSCPRSSYLGDRLAQKAVEGREILGVALSRLASPANETAFAKMSVVTYDPYLNVPDWINKDESLLRRWIKEKGSSV